MNTDDFVKEAVEILTDDDVVKISSHYFKAVADRATNNGVIAFAVVMDAVASAVTLADTVDELAAVANLIQDAAMGVIARRLMVIAGQAETSSEAARAGATVH